MGGAGRFTIGAALWAVLLAISACAGPSGEVALPVPSMLSGPAKSRPVFVREPPPPAPLPEALLGTQWIVVEMLGFEADHPFPRPSDSVPWFEFELDTDFPVPFYRYGGHNGCDWLFGTVRFDVGTMQAYDEPQFEWTLHGFPPKPPCPDGRTDLNALFSFDGPTTVVFGDDGAAVTLAHDGVEVTAVRGVAPPPPEVKFEESSVWTPLQRIQLHLFRLRFYPVDGVELYPVHRLHYA